LAVNARCHTNRPNEQTLVKHPNASLDRATSRFAARRAVSERLDAAVDLGVTTTYATVATCTAVGLLRLSVVTTAVSLPAFVGLVENVTVRPVAVAVVTMLSVAVMVKEKFPVAVGVPLSAPCVVRLRPVGSVPAVTAKVYGAPAPPGSVAVTVWLYAVPYVLPGSVAVLSFGPPGTHRRPCR
jgi:hypothetical protein